MSLRSPKNRNSRSGHLSSESYTYGLRSSGITCDVDGLEPLLVNNEPSRVYLVPTRGYHDGPDPVVSTAFVEQDRSKVYQSMRIQAILSRLAGMIVDDLVGGSSKHAEGVPLARHLVFPEVLQICRKYLERESDLCS